MSGVATEDLIKASFEGPKRLTGGSAGLTGFIDVLEADRALLLTEDACVQSRTQLTLNLVRLYKALGGGWQD